MKKLLVIALLFCSLICRSQLSMYVQPSYPLCDTIKCHFLEVINDSDFEWKTGFVERKKGFVKFADKTSVESPYLPVTSGVVESRLFYFIWICNL